jgi:hypothetical protein
MIALTQPSCHNRLKLLNSFSVSLLVQGNRIKTVAKGKDQIDRSLAEEVVDGDGATLMPGLTEDEIDRTRQQGFGSHIGGSHVGPID